MTFKQIYFDEIGKEKRRTIFRKTVDKCEKMVLDEFKKYIKKNCYCDGCVDGIICDNCKILEPLQKRITGNKK